MDERTGEVLPRDAFDAFEELGRVSLQTTSAQDVLQKVADLCKQVLPGSFEVSVTLLSNDRATSVVYTGQLALDLDESQYGRGYGPCLEAAAGGEVIELPDTRSEPRWPDYAQVCARRGALSSLSVPLPVQQQVAGALNIYAREAQAFRDERVRDLATRFASYAAVGLGNVHAYESIRSQAEHLQKAMESRAVIEQAKGVLVERHRLTPDLAFRMLATSSMNANRKLRDVAEHLVETGELLGR